jgi:predicted nucleic acid-binding protein
MRPAWAYFDTSVLLKRYVREDTSAQARALLRRHRFLSSAIRFRPSCCGSRSCGAVKVARLLRDMDRRSHGEWACVILSVSGS